MKGRKPGKSRFRKAFMAAATIFALGTGGTALDTLPKDAVTDTQSIVTFNIGTDQQYGYNISPIDQMWKHTLSMKSAEQQNNDLLTAAAEADSWRTRALIQQGLDMAKYGQQAMFVAADNGGNDVVKALLEAGVRADAQNSLALLNAVRGNHTQTALDLLDAGAKPYGQDNAILIAAATHGNAVLVEALLDKGAYAGAKNNAALLAAVQNGHTAVADVLLSAEKTVVIPATPVYFDFGVTGAVPAYKNPFNTQATPFTTYTSFGDSYSTYYPGDGFEMGYTLGKATAIDVNANNGQALYEAVYHNDAAMVRTLLAHGADADARDGAIKRLANESRNVEMVNLLKGKAATPTYPNFMGP
jgi:hypothetical protein